MTYKDWHHDFVLLLNHVFPNQVSAEVEVQKGRLDTVITGIREVKTKTFQDKLELMDPTFFKPLLRMTGDVLILEIKTWHESLTLSKLLLFISKLLNHVSNRIKSLDNPQNETRIVYDLTDFSGALLVTRKPQWLNNRHTVSQLSLEEVYPGYYQFSPVFGISLSLIIVNQLEIEDSNYGLLTISSGSKRKEFIRHLIDTLYDNNSHFFLEWMYLHFPNDVLKLLNERGRTMSEVSLNIKRAIKVLGIKKVIQDIGLRPVINEVGLKAVINEVGLKAVINEVGLLPILEIIANMDQDEFKELVKHENPETLKKINQALLELHEKLKTEKE